MFKIYRKNMKKTDETLQKLRHSTAHIMADAVSKLYPGVKLGIGPSIEDGFYYDFDFSGCVKDADDRKAGFLTPEDLPLIEQEMREIIKKDIPFERKVIKKEEALSHFGLKKEVYKEEVIKELEEQEVSLYRHGEFEDLCKGPHIKSTGEVKAFKLLSLAGAYWRGDEKNPMLQRIYGTAFGNKKDLESFLEMIEEAKKKGP